MVAESYDLEIRKVNNGVIEVIIGNYYIKVYGLIVISKIRTSTNYYCMHQYKCFFIGVISGLSL
jgi:hypothetical protein